MKTPGIGKNSRSNTVPIPQPDALIICGAGGRTGIPPAQSCIRYRKGHIDIERLMTRLESLMRYDHAEFADNAVNEYALLLSELKKIP